LDALAQSGLISLSTCLGTALPFFLSENKQINCKHKYISQRESVDPYSNAVYPICTACSFRETLKNTPDLVALVCVASFKLSKQYWAHIWNGLDALGHLGSTFQFGITVTSFPPATLTNMVTAMQI
jgi:hypothetical protein